MYQWYDGPVEYISGLLIIEAEVSVWWLFLLFSVGKVAEISPRDGKCSRLGQCYVHNQNRETCVSERKGVWVGGGGWRESDYFTRL